MAQFDAKVSVLPTSNQPTRGLESYVGEQYRDHDHRFFIQKYHSLYLQERTRRQVLYNSIDFNELQMRIKETISGAEQEPHEVANLNSMLTKYVIFLEQSALNPLDRSQTQKISSLFYFFKKSLQQKKVILEQEWKEKEKRIISLAVPFDHKREEIVDFDNLTREYIQLTSLSWLGGQFQISENTSIVDYGKITQGIEHFEKTFWQPYLHTYQSA